MLYDVCSHPVTHILIQIHIYNAFFCTDFMCGAFSSAAVAQRDCCGATNKRNQQYRTHAYAHATAERH